MHVRRASATSVRAPSGAALVAGAAGGGGRPPVAHDNKKRRGMIERTASEYRLVRT
jgi:hypothetical protein